MSDSFRTIIIPASLASQARELGAALSPAGDDMYLTGLSATGNEPATSYISSGFIGASFASLLPLTTITPAVPPATEPMISTTPGNAAVLFGAASQGAVAQGLTLTATQADATALLAQSDVSEQKPFVAMVRLNLQLIRGTL